MHCTNKLTYIVWFINKRAMDGHLGNINVRKVLNMDPKSSLENQNYQICGLEIILIITSDGCLICQMNK